MRKQCCPKIPFKKVTHIIFDMDGTLIDTESLNEDVMSEILQRYDKEFTVDLHIKTAGRILEEAVSLLITDLDLPLTQDEFVLLYKDLFYQRCAEIQFLPGAAELVKHFHANNVPIAVGTSSSEDLVAAKTQNLKQVFELFHHIVCGGSDPEVKAGKPAPDIFLVCASRFDEKPDPECCLVLEDAPNGVMAAKKAGMQVVMIPKATVPYEIWKKATLRLDTLEYMAPELFGLPPLQFTGAVIPKISFTMHYEDDKVKKREKGEKKEEENKDSDSLDQMGKEKEKGKKEKGDDSDSSLEQEVIKKGETGKDE